MGWIGGVLAYLAVQVPAVVSGDAAAWRSAAVAMESIATFVIVPLAIASLATGLLMALGTPWGLFRHYWVLISFLLTLVAVVVLLAHMPDVSAGADAARLGGMSGAHDPAGAHTSGRGDFLHSGGGLVVLLVITALNVFKPRGLTRYG